MRRALKAMFSVAYVYMMSFARVASLLPHTLFFDLDMVLISLATLIKGVKTVEAVMILDLLISSLISARGVVIQMSRSPRES